MSPPVAKLKKFRAPPINEVVCGLMFEPLAGLDPVTIGFYAKERRDDFPKHETHPALGEPPVLVAGGAMPIRVWLVSADDAFVVQIQRDRFYINWRARGTEYPRFSGHEGREGIVQKLQAEFSRFEQFCARTFEQELALKGIELAKIDHVIEGKHWNGIEDLGEAVPWLRTVPGFSRSEKPLISIRFVEPRLQGKLAVSLDLMEAKDQVGTPTRLVKIESRIVRDAKGDMRELSDEFLTANDELNEVFMSVIPPDQAEKRFNEWK